MVKSSKGSSFEREVCKELSLWWTNQEADDIFWRSHTSGARATQRKKKGKTTYGQDGDVTATHPCGQPLLDFFSIEIKRGYAKHTIHDCLDKAKTMKQQPFADFIEQAWLGHDNAQSRYWLLIHKRDRRMAMAYFPKDAFADLYKNSKSKTYVKTEARFHMSQFPLSFGEKFDYIVAIPFKIFLDIFNPCNFKD